MQFLQCKHWSKISLYWLMHNSDAYIQQCINLDALDMHISNKKFSSLVLEFETIDNPNKHTQIDEKDKSTTWPRFLLLYLKNRIHVKTTPLFYFQNGTFNNVFLLKRRYICMYHVWCLVIQDLSSKFIYCTCICYSTNWNPVGSGILLVQIGIPISTSRN